MQMIDSCSLEQYCVLPDQQWSYMELRLRYEINFFSFKKKIDCFNLSPYLSGRPNWYFFIYISYD